MQTGVGFRGRYWCNIGHGCRGRYWCKRHPWPILVQTLIDAMTCRDAHVQECRFRGLDPSPLTLNPQPSTLNPQPPTLNPQLYLGRCGICRCVCKILHVTLRTRAGIRTSYSHILLPTRYPYSHTLLPTRHSHTLLPTRYYSHLPPLISLNFTPSPYTQRPTPYTLHPEPYTLHPTPKR